MLVTHSKKKNPNRYKGKKPFNKKMFNSRPNKSSVSKRGNKEILKKKKPLQSRNKKLIKKNKTRFRDTKGLKKTKKISFLKKKKNLFYKPTRFVRFHRLYTDVLNNIIKKFLVIGNRSSLEVKLLLSKYLTIDQIVIVQLLIDDNISLRAFNKVSKLNKYFRLLIKFLIQIEHKPLNYNVKMSAKDTLLLLFSRRRLISKKKKKIKKNNGNLSGIWFYLLRLKKKKKNRYLRLKFVFVYFLKIFKLVKNIINFKNGLLTPQEFANKYFVLFTKRNNINETFKNINFLYQKKKFTSNKSTSSLVFNVNKFRCCSLDFFKIILKIHAAHSIGKLFNHRVSKKNLKTNDKKKKKLSLQKKALAAYRGVKKLMQRYNMSTRVNKTYQSLRIFLEIFNLRILKLWRISREARSKKFGGLLIDHFAYYDLNIARILFLANFSHSLIAACSLVRNGSVCVNGRVINNPTYIVKPFDLVCLMAKVRDINRYSFLSKLLGCGKLKFSNKFTNLFEYNFKIFGFMLLPFRLKYRCLSLYPKYSSFNSGRFKIEK